MYGTRKLIRFRESFGKSRHGQKCQRKWRRVSGRRATRKNTSHVFPENRSTTCNRTTAANYARFWNRLAKASSPCAVFAGPCSRSDRARVQSFGRPRYTKTIIDKHSLSRNAVDFHGRLTRVYRHPLYTYHVLCTCNISVTVSAAYDCEFSAITYFDILQKKKTFFRARGRFGVILKNYFIFHRFIKRFSHTDR